VRKHLSVGMLLAGSTLVPVIGLLTAAAAVEAALFFTAAAEERYLFLYGSRLPLMAGIGFVGLCAVLTLTGSFGSKTRYTLQRLSVTERTVTLWQGAYNAVCLLIAWGAQLGLLLFFWYLTRQTEGAGLSDQEAFIYFYLNGFAHSLLPLSEATRLVRNAVLAVGWRSVYALRNRVEVTGTTRSGNGSAAAGLEISVCSGELNDGLHWNTVFPADQKDEARTDFSYTPQSRRNRQPTVCNGLQLDNITRVVGSLPEEDYGLYRLLQDVESRTPAGKTHTETVSLADYYDTYPLAVSVNLPNCWYWRGELFQDGTTQDNNDWDKLIRSNFQIPVAEGHQIKVTLQKNAAGTVTNCEVYALSEPGARSESGILSESVVSEDRCYFTAGPTMDGRMLDFSGTPGGYGVWYFDFDREHPQAAGTVIRNICPVDIFREKIEKIALADSGKKLLVLTREENRQWINVLDAGSGQAVQRLALMDSDRIYDCPQIFDGDDFLVVMDLDGAFTVLTLAETGYELAFTGVCRNKDAASSTMNTAFGFGQGKLAVSVNRAYFNDVSCEVSVYDQTGCLYEGEYSIGSSQINYGGVSLTWRGAGDGA